MQLGINKSGVKRSDPYSPTSQEHARDARDNYYHADQTSQFHQPPKMHRKRKHSKLSKMVIGLGVASVSTAGVIAGVSGATQFGNFDPAFGDKFFNAPETFAASVAVVPAYFGGTAVGYAALAKSKKS